MASQTWESEFERELCEHLAAHGWRYSPNDTGYDRVLALFPDDVFAWLADTQPDELAKKIKPGSSPEAQAKAQQAVLRRLADVLDKGQAGAGGSLKVLREGFKDAPASYQMMQKRPDQSRNTTVMDRYAANRLRVMRQVHYSGKHPDRSIDLVFFVNGIPVATAELKTDFTRSIADAKRQYMTDRPTAGEPLLGFGTRALVHFAVSNDEVGMTTRLAELKTAFLPFNRGHDGHEGNGPDEDGGSPTTYLWRDVLRRDAWLDILGRFMHYEESTTTDPVTKRTRRTHTLIFPRYHQLDAVTKIVADARRHGPGQRYLIQHSAGSGKTRSIAWAAHRLATLHDDANDKVFDTVIVVTDRTVLDAQLQEAVKQIEPKAGMVATISPREAAKKSFSSKSAYLTNVLAHGQAIIVVTLQTFPFVLEAIQENKALLGRKFVVIADEAHSSQTGEAAGKLKQVLSAEEAATLDDGGEIDVETVLAAKAKSKADTRNITFLAFTATPKDKTMQMFGTPGADGLPHPFHTYTMAQAIEEGFILDVLRSYTTYQTAFQLGIRTENGDIRIPRMEESGELVDETAATKGLMRWVKLHPTNISQKVAIIVEHFEANVKHLLDGHAKAMVVTDSRVAAVRYKVAMDAYIARHGYTQYTSLVAFSGDVVDDETPSTLTNAEGKFTEASMNPGVRDLRTAFAEDRYRVMIVANKFQTGFDQPLLCAMYVDKQLSGVAAVQTLSRLNRAYPGKDTTMILDFVNSEDDILAAFKPYYAEAEIIGTTDPNKLHDLHAKLDGAGLYTDSEIDAVVTAYLGKLGNNKIVGALQPTKTRFAEAYKAALSSKDRTALDDLDIFRKDVSTYVKLHDFLSQIIDFGDTDVEKHAIFFRLLAPLIRGKQTSDVIDLSEVTLVNITQRNKGTSTIDLPGAGTSPLKPTGAAGSGRARDPRLILLDELIARLNELFAGEGFDDHQIRSWIEGLLTAMKDDQQLRDQATANSREQFLASHALRDKLLIAVAMNEHAHHRMAELIHQKASIEDAVLRPLGELLYSELHGPHSRFADVQAAPEPPVEVDLASHQPDHERAPAQVSPWRPDR